MKKLRTIFLITLSIISILIIGLLICFGICNNDKNHYFVNDTLKDGNGQSAKVILLAGQSNASGCSLDQYLKKNVSESKYQEYEEGYDNVYINYYSTNMNVSREFVKCRNKQGDTNEMFGPELGLAEELNKKYPDQLFFIIKFAWNGSNLYNQWKSPSSFGSTGKLYKEFIQYTKTSLEYLVMKNYDISIEGICFMQGESDSYVESIAKKYEYNLTNFIYDLRCEFAEYSSADGIAFIDACIADNPSLWIHCKTINDAKANVAKSSEQNVLIDTNLYGLTCVYEPVRTPDTAHYDSLSQIKLGQLFAQHISLFFDK